MLPNNTPCNTLTILRNQIFGNNLNIKFNFKWGNIENLTAEMSMTRHRLVSGRVHKNPFKKGPLIYSWIGYCIG